MRYTKQTPITEEDVINIVKDDDILELASPYVDWKLPMNGYHIIADDFIDGTIEWLLLNIFGIDVDEYGSKDTEEIIGVSSDTDSSNEVFALHSSKLGKNILVAMDESNGIICFNT